MEYYKWGEIRKNMAIHIFLFTKCLYTDGQKERHDDGGTCANWDPKTRKGGYHTLLIEVC